MSESIGRMAPRTYVVTEVASVPRSVTASPKTAQQAADALKSKLGADVVKAVEAEQAGDHFILVDSSKIVDVLQFLRDDSEFYCSNLQVVSATDFPVKAENEESQRKAFDTIEVMYAVQSYAHKHELRIKVQLDRSAPKVASVTSLFRSANWYERECYDLLGIHFEGHPNHKRILLPPDWIGHPLRKDYEFPEEYNGMKVPL